MRATNHSVAGSIPALGTSRLGRSYWMSTKNNSVIRSLPLWPLTM